MNFFSTDSKTQLSEFNEKFYDKTFQELKSFRIK